MTSSSSFSLTPSTHTETPQFQTERFLVAPLTPPKARELIGVLLQDPLLAGQVPWLEERTKDGALREAFLLQLQCVAGTAKVWGIIDRARRMLIGAVLARNEVASIDIEVLCASQFWNQGVADEAGKPVAEWLEDEAQSRPILTH